MKNLVVGQRFELIGGYVPELGTVVKIEPPFIYVATSWGRLRFDADGYECNTDGTQAEGHYIPQCVLPFKPRLSLRGEKLEF